jgi:lipopolysaccharide export system protein LptA
MKKKLPSKARFVPIKGFAYWCLAFGFMVQVFCNAATAQNKNLIVLQNADSLIGTTINGEDVRELHGHVRLSQGNVKVWCDNAIQFLKRNVVDLTGNVKMVQDTVTLTAKQGMYYGDEKKASCQDGVRLETQHVVLLADYGDYYMDEKRAFFRSNVRVIDSTTTIHSDELTYYENERKSIAVHNVRIDNSENHIRIFGDHLEHYDQTHYSKMTQNPRLMQIDTTSKGEIDTLVVRSVVMESYDDSSKRLIATDSVAIVRGPLAARCGWVRYWTKIQYIELFQQPVVWYEDNQVTGDSISLFMANNRLNRAFISGHAFAISLSDSLYPGRYNQLTGRHIEMKFADEKLSEIAVDQNAISLYFLYNGKKTNGVNETSGDFISSKFTDGKLQTISVIHGIEGNYYPENMIEDNIAKYNLDGFHLHTDRPTKLSVFPQLQNL